ncbi:hypothetical protein KIL84_009496 [Mauremys mutica]|uniref:Uncharacterized protein n=1 Tax=Mauremys mutica TaxID=74926 RepID=A0A9D4AQD7_9SAUR|nr:hypothetical protein KIL84_009496 [Mauremys mutica]
MASLRYRVYGLRPGLFAQRMKTLWVPLLLAHLASSVSSAGLRGRWRAETKEMGGETAGQGWEAGIPADERRGDGHSLPLDMRFLAMSSGQPTKGEDSVGNAKGAGTDNTTGILGVAGEWHEPDIVTRLLSRFRSVQLVKQPSYIKWASSPIDSHRAMAKGPQLRFGQ